MFVSSDGVDVDAPIPLIEVVADEHRRPVGRVVAGEADVGSRVCFCQRGNLAGSPSAATAMLTNGVPLKVVSEILGHASIVITADIYGHISPDVSREALATLSKSVLA